MPFQTKRMKQFIFIYIILAAVLFSYAGKRKRTEDLPLLNTKWILIEISETRVNEKNNTAFIVFYDNYKFSGNFGCNYFFGEFTFRKKRIKIDYQGSTKSYCTSMELEEQFSKAIKNEITNYYIEKNKLYLLNKNKTVCKFEGLTLLN